MKVNSRFRHLLKMQNTAFFVMFMIVIGLLAFISTKYNFSADWSTSQRHSLSDASLNLLQNLNETVNVIVLISEEATTRQSIAEFLKRYERASSNIKVKFIDPGLEPSLARRHSITTEGELIIEIGDRSEVVRLLSEQNITNAMHRLSRSNDRWLLFVEGHGERKPDGIANHDFGEWGRQLLNKGFKVRTINLAENPIIPLTISALVIASPQVEYLPGEIESINQYLNNGGNLLWLVEPESNSGLKSLAASLDVVLMPGRIIDPNTKRLIKGDPRIAIVSSYPRHDITRNFTGTTLFPNARALKYNAAGSWRHDIVLQTMEGSWIEIDELKDKVKYDQDRDIPGPLTIAIAVSRNVHDTPASTSATDSKSRNQRVLIIGGGDFLSNRFLKNGVNPDLGQNLVNWLAHDDQLISIPSRSTPDLELEMSRTSQIVIAFGFLIILPLLLGGSGFAIWLRRRRR